MAFIGPAHIDILPWNNVKASSAAITRVGSSAALTGGYAHASVTVGNWMTWDVALMAGTWTVTVEYVKLSSGGVFTASLDGVDLSPTVDTYAAGTTYNNVVRWTGVSVAAGGVKEFKLRVDSKNASSSSYFQLIQLVTFTNTDAPTQSFTCAGPSRFDIIPYGYWGQTAGNAPFPAQSSVYLSGGIVTAAASASNQIGWYLPLTAGTWNLDFIYYSNSDAPIFTVSIDGSTVGTIDCYSVSGLQNVVTTISGVAVASSKFALLKIATPTKNASSSSYVQRLQHIALRKTA